MKRSVKLAVSGGAAGALLLGAAAGESAAATAQTRSDAADSPGPAAADLRAIVWTHEAGTAKLEVHLRNQDATAQRVVVWVDSDDDAKADVLVRILRDTKTTANVAVEPVTAPPSPPCQPLAGDKAITTDVAAPVAVEGDLMKVSVAFALSPPTGRFRWAAYGDSTGDAQPYDFAPDALAPAAGDDRFCDGGISADLARGARFPDGPPVAAFTTDLAEPLDDRPFKALSTATDGDGSIVDWRWDTGGDDAFDDGSGAELTLHLPAGDHAVALKVTDDDGLSAVVRQTIAVRSTAAAFTISDLGMFGERMWFIPDGIQPPRGTALDGGNEAPVVRVRVTPRRPRAGQIVQLDATGTRDDGRVTGFEWDLDGDGEAGEGQGARVRTAFSRAGKARVTVLARDERGLAARADVTVSVRASAPLPIAAAIRRARRASKPGGAFERGLGGWKRVGKAFPAMPVRRPTLPAAVELGTAGRLGGSYASAQVPVNAAGKGWVSSRGARATGALVSPAFKVTRRYLTLRVGGEDELRGKRSLERVEVWVRRRDALRKVATIPAGTTERMREVTVDLKRARGADATVVAIDEGTAGHLNLDEVRLNPRRPAEPVPPAVVGFADTHTHAMVHQSFGALQGHRTYMGVPGGRHSDYTRGAPGASQFMADMRDNGTHFAGTPLVQAGLSAVHAVAPDAVAGLHEHMHITEIRRAWRGGLRLMSSLAVTNELLEHATGAVANRRTGGPACVAVGVFCTTNGLVDDTVAVSGDRRIIEAAVHGMRALAAMNADWMEIVYDPEQAYDVMRRGRLAIVLGTEVDSLGRLGVGGPEAEVDWLWSRGIRQVTPVHAIDNPIGGAAEFQDIYNTTQDLVNRPIHDADTVTIANELRQDGVRLRNPAARFGALMGVESWGCKNPVRGAVLPPGECLHWRYSPDQTILGLSAAGIPRPWFVRTDARTPVYSGSVQTDGQRNRTGLAPLGLRYVRALIRRGMLIDIEHMSDRTADAVIASGTNPGAPRGPVWDALGEGENGCEPGGPLYARSVRPGCYDSAYPLMSSHTTIRGQSLVPNQEFAAGVTTLPAVSRLKDNWAREFERTPRQIEYIRESGGTIAPFTGMEPTLRPLTTTRPARGAPGVAVFRGEDHPLRTDADRLDLNDCAGSSKSWITAYLYAVQKMGGRGVALSTDMGVVAAGSRFNPSDAHPLLPKNCPASYANSIPSFDLLTLGGGFAPLVDYAARLRDEEEAGYRWQFNRTGQRNPVRYHPPDGRPWPVGSLLEHISPDGRTYDVNTQGMKTYGTLPDMLQDAINSGVAPEDLRPLLGSAQSYVDMWRKAYRLTGCDAGDGPADSALYQRCAGSGSPIDPGIAACANTCPDSPGRGHALLPDGSRMFP